MVMLNRIEIQQLDFDLDLTGIPDIQHILSYFDALEVSLLNRGPLTSPLKSNFE